MKVAAARVAARDWVQQHAASEPGFVGAYFSGSTIYLPADAEVPIGSDIDVMIASDREESSHRTKFVHRGALLEASHHPWRLFSSLETIPSAHSLRLDGSIIADPSGRLAPLQAALARQFAEPAQVRRRSEVIWHQTRQALGQLDPLAPWPQQVMGWVFTTSWTALLPLVAAVRNPTVRLRYLAARELLREYGLEQTYPRLLELLGCLHLRLDRAAQHLDELTRTFDLAAEVARTPFPFSCDITPIARPIAIDGIRAQLQQGNHREVVFWLVATATRCHSILVADAPELERERSPAFAALLADLGIQSPADLASRAQAVIAFLPMLWETTEAILARNERRRDPAGG
jgi:hypothetical protein